MGVAELCILALLKGDGEVSIVETLGRAARGVLDLGGVGLLGGRHD